MAQASPTVSSTCCASGVCVASVLCLPGIASLLKDSSILFSDSQSSITSLSPTCSGKAKAGILLSLLHCRGLMVKGPFLLSCRFEKDVRLSYFWTRCIKLFLVRLSLWLWLMQLGHRGLPSKLGSWFENDCGFVRCRCSCAIVRHAFITCSLHGIQRAKSRRHGWERLCLTSGRSRCGRGM